MAMQTNGLAARQGGADLVESVVMQGDLSKLSAQERVSYYGRVCASLNLNPLTRPFDYLTLNGKMILYAKRDCTDQLRSVHHVSITKLERDRLDDVYVVTAYASTPDGRQDSAIGAVPIASLKGEALANAFMKAETKAKRRVTLSICGLGLTDETEVDSIPGAVHPQVNFETGEIVEHAPALPPLASTVEPTHDQDAADADRPTCADCKSVITSEVDPKTGDVIDALRIARKVEQTTGRALCKTCYFAWKADGPSVNAAPPKRTYDTVFGEPAPSGAAL